MAKSNSGSLPVAGRASNDGAASPIFGVTLELRGQEVALSTDTVIPEKGFEFGLTKEVKLGSPSDFLGWLDETFKTDLKNTLNPEKLPDPIKNLINNLLNVEIGIIKAHIIVPPKNSTDSAKYTLVFSATFPGKGIQLIPGSDILLLKGGVAGATNENPR